ncbi:MAG: Hsp20/alpha crystallin family protein [Lachnospiraceae bacterium]|nr:Hsp20/alpha crystallin family protein [Lachnospiraceae bacterium]
MLMPNIWGENLFDDFFDDFHYPRKAPQPPKKPEIEIMKTDIKETDSGYELSVELPGYKKEDIKIELNNGCLTISAELKHEEDQSDNGKYIRRERYYGKTARSFYVSEILTEKDISAKYSDGILNICIPKKELKPEVEETKYITIE